MSKRKEPAQKQFSESSSEDEDTDMLDVDFEWFDPQPAHDFHGLKTLIRQLFDVDAQLFNMSELTDLILAQPLLGSTVKVDGNETDPYAFLTVLNLKEHKGKEVIKALTKYLTQKAKTNPALKTVADLLESYGQAEVGLILTEKLVNIPTEVVPPMYRMLLEEISWAVEDKEPYTFSHYLILSKTYLEVQSALNQEGERPQKKKKKGSSREDSKEIFYFHAEDDVLQRHSIAYGGFSYTKEEGDGQADAKRAFQDLGIKPQGHMMLLDASEFERAVQAVENFMQPS
ncbi:MAG: Mss4p nuclear export [Icmadophila ericetorum]|nr:Mss4p nuclear export [Icmadophila ericetorum]